jgi:hypothetical protein
MLVENYHLYNRQTYNLVEGVLRHSKPIIEQKPRVAFRPIRIKYFFPFEYFLISILDNEPMLLIRKVPASQLGCFVVQHIGNGD